MPKRIAIPACSPDRVAKFPATTNGLKPGPAGCAAFAFTRPHKKDSYTRLDGAKLR